MNKKTVIVRLKKKKQSKFSLLLSQLFKRKALSFLSLAVILLAIPLTIIQGSHLQDNRQHAEREGLCIDQCGRSYDICKASCDDILRANAGSCEQLTGTLKDECNHRVSAAYTECIQGSQTGCETVLHSCQSSCSAQTPPENTPITPDQPTVSTLEAAQPSNGCKDIIQTCTDTGCSNRTVCNDDCSKNAWGNRTCTPPPSSEPAPQSAPPSVGTIGSCEESCPAQCMDKPDTCVTACENKCHNAATKPSPDTPAETAPDKSGGGKPSGTGATNTTNKRGGNTSSGDNDGNDNSSSPKAAPVATSAPQKQVSCSDNPIPSGEHKIWKAYCEKVCVTNSDCKSLPGWPDASQCYPFTNGSYCIQLQYNNIAGLCRDNPVKPPDGLSWKASCSQECTQNSDCPTTPGLTNSNWCYGFDDGARCLQLQNKNALVSAPKDIVNAVKQQVNVFWDEVISFFSSLTKHK